MKKPFTVIGALVGASLGAACGCPGTRLLVWFMYWGGESRGIAEEAFVPLAWGGFVVFGAAAGALAGHLFSRRGDR